MKQINHTRMKNILIIICLLVPVLGYGQATIKIGGGSSSSVNPAAVGAQISDSLAALTLGVDIATSADSVLVIDDGKLKIMSKAEFLADIYSALSQMAGLDMVAPTIDSIEVGRYNDSILVAFFHESDTHIDSIPPISAFNITEGGVTVGLDTILFSATGDSLMVVMDSLAKYGLTYLFDYTKAYKHVQDSSGNDLASFSNHAVSNYVTLPADTLGAEMITNGVFTDGTGWSAEPGWTIGSGVATYDDATPDASLYQTNAAMVSGVEANTTYRLTFVLSGNATLEIRGNVEYVPLADYSSGLVVVRFTTPANIGTGGFLFLGKTFSESAFSVDNISLKKVL